MTAPKINFPAENSPQRAKSSGSLNIRAKVVPLKPGRSLMDWIRLGKSGQDLAGTGGRVQVVTEEELSKHNKEQDAWISIRGRVYNMTPYLEYHPGGIPEIMRGVGRDATDLFDETHKWVNAESMLEKCFIGPLQRSNVVKKTKPSRTGSGNSLNVSSGSLRSHNSLFVPSAQVDGFTVPVPPQKSQDPRYDWYQNDKIVTISVFTRKKEVQVEDIILELKDGKEFDAVFILGEKSFRIHLALSNLISHQQVRMSGESGKVDILLTKEAAGVQWTELGQGLQGNNSFKPHKERDSRLWDCRVISVDSVTHNCKLFCCELPKGVIMRIPIGHHIHMTRDVEGMQISRPYTVVLPSLQVDPSEREFDGRRFYLIIKLYPEGTLTPTLNPVVAAWIGAMAMGLNFFFGPISSALCDRFGCRVVTFAGALLSVSGLFLTSFVQEVHMMYVTYGLVWGLGSSFSFTSSIVVLNEYFVERFALANGIATSGSGVGSLVAGPVINYLLASVGWKHSMHILSGFAGLLCIAAMIFKPKERRECTKLFDTSIWKSKAYVLWVTTVAVFQFGYLIPFIHLVKYAEDLGVPKSKGAWLIGFLSINSTLGRVVFGKISDFKFVNRLYLYQFSIFSIGLSTLLCPLVKNYAGLVGYALTFGFFDGCFVGQVAVITGDLVGRDKLSQAVGNMFGTLAIPMSLGPPLAGWLHEAFGSYDKAFYIAGSVALFSSLMIFGVNYMIRKQSIARRQLGFKKDSSWRVSEAETAPDSVYKDTLLLVERETVL